MPHTSQLAGYETIIRDAERMSMYFAEVAAEARLAKHRAEEALRKRPLAPLLVLAGAGLAGSHPCLHPERTDHRFTPRIVFQRAEECN
jgi:hypothetical protein